MHDDDAPQIVQSLLDAYKRQSYDLNKAHGDEIVSVVGVPVTVARVSLPTEYARDWVVTLGAVTTPGQQGAAAGGVLAGLNPQLLSDAFAVVEWGMGASSNWAVVDWQPGQQFSVYGSFVKVHAQINAFGLPFGAVPDPSTRFSGHIAPGRSTRTAIRTVDYGLVPLAGAPVERAVPPFARRFTWSDRNFGSPEFQGLHVSAGAITWRLRPGGGKTMEPLFTIPIGTGFITVLALGADLTNMQVIYEIGLS